MQNRGLYWEFGSTQAYRLGDWKLLQINTKDGVEMHLYNLADDESESANLATQLPQQVELLKQHAMSSRTTSDEFKSFLDEL